MDLDILKKLIKLVEKSRVNEIEIEEEGKKIRISKGHHAHAQPPPAVQAPIVPPAADTTIKAASPEDSGLHPIKSELVGTFYRAPSEDAENFVKEGDVVRKGQTLCIIEAMKIMNEIESDINGRVIRVMVDNGAPVEYGELLFQIEAA